MSGDSFDAVVIGSGLGGLTAAALLAKAGRRVCVIERNNSVGGCASVFKKGALTIEPALHQTADPRDPSEPKHEILKELGLLDEIEWVPVSPFFSVRGGPVGDVFDLPIDLLETVQAGVADLSRARAEPSVGKLLRGVLELRSLAGDWRASLDDVLARTLGDHEAPKFAIAGNLGYYADDPRRMWWPFFCAGAGRISESRRRLHKSRFRIECQLKANSFPPPRLVCYSTVAPSSGESAASTTASLVAMTRRHSSHLKKNFPRGEVVRQLPLAHFWWPALPAADYPLQPDTPLP